MASGHTHHCQSSGFNIALKLHKMSPLKELGPTVEGPLCLILANPYESVLFKIKTIFIRET